MSLELPASLDLPPHLSAHKYFFVCTLTVAAWDTLVLSPRTWKLFRTQGWPLLKILYHFMRIFMPLEFTVVGVAFFDTQWSQSACQKFYLFEPICTAILLAAASAVHVIRIHAIYDKSRAVLFGLGSVFAAQVVVTAVCCAFYRCIKHDWVGIYWVFPTLLYTASVLWSGLDAFLQIVDQKPLTLWRLMLRDGLNLYGAVWLVNMTNMLFLFIMKPTDETDPVKTIVTSMAAVLTTSMTLRIILSVRGSLAQGGTFSTGSAHTSSSRTTHVLSTRSGGPATVSRAPHTYTLDDIRSKREGEWSQNSVKDDKGVLPIDGSQPEIASPEGEGNMGVKITVDREIGYDVYPHAK
ncbi:hypothetical protein BDZ89DRAFT_1098958 [Hymenopellis radicata]|nr:hypothetical protein BDZ89DRAFT_1098958 [Hymenopellis radicata]